MGGAGRRGGGTGTSPMRHEQARDSTLPARLLLLRPEAYRDRRRCGRGTPDRPLGFPALFDSFLSLESMPGGERAEFGERRRNAPSPCSATGADEGTTHAGRPVRAIQSETESPWPGLKLGSAPQSPTSQRDAMLRRCASRRLAAMEERDPPLPRPTQCGACSAGTPLPACTEGELAKLRHSRALGAVTTHFRRDRRFHVEQSRSQSLGSPRILV